METYEQKVERVARALWASLAPSRAEDDWGSQSEYYRNRYRAAAKAALEEEARDIEADLTEPEPKQKLTLPLKDGQRVILGDGTVATIRPSPANNRICRVEVGTRLINHVFRDTGLCRGGRREVGQPPTHQEAVADA